MQRPLAFIDETGYIVPNPTFSEESKRHLKGRFIYTPSELDAAIEEMKRRTDDRRYLADREYGAEMVRAPHGMEQIADAVEALEHEKMTVPGFDKPPSAKRKTGGVSGALKAPNEAPLPASMNTPVERSDAKNIDAAAAMTAMFGGSK